MPENNDTKICQCPWCIARKRAWSVAKGYDSKGYEAFVKATKEWQENCPARPKREA